jgi:hypothetical protein
MLKSEGAGNAATTGIQRLSVQSGALQDVDLRGAFQECFLMAMHMDFRFTLKLRRMRTTTF